jgi:hypothetical protein
VAQAALPYLHLQNTFHWVNETIQDRDEERPHPATFPVRLPGYCLRLHGLGRIREAADPFLGLGNDDVACARIGVSFVGIEMDAGSGDYSFSFSFLGSGGGRSEYALRDHTFTRSRVVLTSSFRLRLVGSGFDE